MESQDSKLMNEFRSRTQTLLAQMTSLLEDIESDAISQGVEAKTNHHKSFLEYARLAEMIAKAAGSLGRASQEASHPLHRLEDYSLICKSVALQTAGIRENQTLYVTAIALLQDATEVLLEMIQSISSMLWQTEKADPIRSHMNQQLVDRLKWVSYQFVEQGKRSEAGASDSEKMGQNEIDDLLKKLGVA